MTLSTVGGETLPRALRTRSTVAVPTRASLAMSASLIFFIG
jgi:hypothetical protein